MCYKLMRKHSYFIFLDNRSFYTPRKITRQIVCKTGNRLKKYRLLSLKNMDNSARPRINGNMMSSHQGRNVCLLGMAKEVDNSGRFFTLTTCDGKDVRVDMAEPLSEYVAGLTEVHGRINRNSIQCDNYIVFSEQASSTFNMELYNQAVELQAKFPNHYITGVNQQ